MTTVLDQINRELLGRVKPKRTFTLFSDTESDFFSALHKQLNLSDDMAIHDLLKAIAILESIPAFKNYLDKERYRTLDDLKSLKLDIPEQAVFSGRPKVSPSLFPLLTKIHDRLFSSYESAYLHARGELPVNQVDYHQVMIEESQKFNEMSLTTKQAVLPDGATIVKDVGRGSVTIAGKKIVTEDSSDPSAIIAAIESLTGDKITTPGSKANKIFNFGGQFLQGTLLQEFCSTAMLVGKKIVGLESGYTKGMINWTKDVTTGEFVAQVKLKVLTCSYVNYQNKKEAPKLYAIAADGHTLLDVDADAVENIMQRAKSEINGSTVNDMVPIAEIDAVIRLVPQPYKLPQQHFMKVETASIHYNTADMVSTKERGLLAELVIEHTNSSVTATTGF
ncbi:hypothetical protein [Legionella feeleii]|uniref:Uncharacterized protein n=1 Tax=Legionella feeleii TaxID=453 RepID=A0A0W0TLE5_9GAMM|nr:hypothetical protein [Legionella feeleii]KTC96333.1 hypothetical protein Lfee_2131 [Legionella feeleii]SPX62550.1 Uncharacterised protein [Legionella feeleii]